MRAGEDEEQLKHALLVAIRNNTSFLGKKWAVFHTLNSIFTSWANNSACGYLSREIESYVHIKACAQIYMVTLYVVAKQWKHPKCLLPGKWITDSGTATAWNMTQQWQRMCSWYIGQLSLKDTVLSEGAAFKVFTVYGPGQSHMTFSSRQNHDGE